MIYRRDTTGKGHYIKEIGERVLPHTHIYTWKKIKGVWTIIKEIILPY